MPLFYRWLKSTLPAILLLLVFWTFIGFPLSKIGPVSFALIVNGVIGLLIILFYIRYELVTILTGSILAPFLFYGAAAFYADSDFIVTHGLILLGVPFLMLVLGIIALRCRPPSKEVDSYVPDYLKRIHKRERIKRELEIARNVQIGFLPSHNPSIEGMDIASICIPAEEVGGDYYDYVELSPKKLGVVIGDVSGKGISAAFYMTLTKGLLKSQARRSYSPQDILMNMNELFYENSNRGVFISMIYGIFDLDAKTLTFARAGHNPMILRRPEKGLVEEICPPGIALGLEKGPIFNRSIEEKTIGLEKEDVFLFYTDGLNEAQNRKQEEFGEDRLMQLIQKQSHLSAAELLQTIQKRMQQFIGKAPQHDDMTIMIVKIM
jgi:sigma-B regulation protein RsbU (phosphoserine phosphatase)